MWSWLAKALPFAKSAIGGIFNWITKKKGADGKMVSRDWDQFFGGTLNHLTRLGTLWSAFNPEAAMRRIGNLGHAQAGYDIFQERYNNPEQTRQQAMGQVGPRGANTFEGQPGTGFRERSDG